MSYQTQHLHTAPTRAALDAQHGSTLLEFGAPWCPHCQRAQALIAQALAAYPETEHLKIEDGRGQALGRSYGVKLWPTLIALHNGKEMARSVRPQSTQDIAQALAQAGPLQFAYLDFDHSDDAEGAHCWDAMACLPPERLDALCAEIARLLAWAHSRFPGRRAPLDEGGDWDYDLQAQTTHGTPLTLHYDPALARITLPSGLPQQRLTVTLCLCGSNAFARALEEEWRDGSAP